MKKGDKGLLGGEEREKKGEKGEKGKKEEKKWNFSCFRQLFCHFSAFSCNFQHFSPLSVMNVWYLYAVDVTCSAYIYIAKTNIFYIFRLLMNGLGYTKYQMENQKTISLLMEKQKIR